MTTKVLDLWTPDSIEYIQSWIVTDEQGYVPLIEDGNQPVWKHEFQLTYRGEIEMFGVLAEQSASDDQISEVAHWVAERAMKQLIEKQQKRSGIAPDDLHKKEHTRARRDLAAILRDFRKQNTKRVASSNKRIYYRGLK